MEPFTVTLEQWLKLEGHQVQRTGRDMRYLGPHAPRTLWPGCTSKRKVIALQHRCEVQRAIIECQPITTNVLHDYPDLAAQAGQKGLICGDAITRVVRREGTFLL